MGKLKKNKGITLIALVISIIVLLILAGVAINLAIGENGLFNQTKLAVEKYKDAQNKEEEQLQIAANAMLGDAETREGTVTIDEGTLQNILHRLDELESDTGTLKTQMQSITSKTVITKDYSNITIPAQSNGNYGTVNIEEITFDHDCTIQVTGWMQRNTAESGQVAMQIFSTRNNTPIKQVWSGANNSTIGGYDISGIFSMKAGDSLQFRVWNWCTSSQVIDYAQLWYCEL